MPATLYGIGLTDTNQLGALHPAPRAQVLRLIGLTMCLLWLHLLSAVRARLLLLY